METIECKRAQRRRAMTKSSVESGCPEGLRRYMYFTADLNSPLLDNDRIRKMIEGRCAPRAPGLSQYRMNSHVFDTRPGLESNERPAVSKLTITGGGSGSFSTTTCPNTKGNTALVLYDTTTRLPPPPRRTAHPVSGSKARQSAVQSAKAHHAHEKRGPAADDATLSANRQPVLQPSPSLFFAALSTSRDLASSVVHHSVGLSVDTDVSFFSRLRALPRRFSPALPYFVHASPATCVESRAHRHPPSRCSPGGLLDYGYECIPGKEAGSGETFIGCDFGGGLNGVRGVRVAVGRLPRRVVVCLMFPSFGALSTCTALLLLDLTVGAPDMRFSRAYHSIPLRFICSSSHPLLVIPVFTASHPFLIRPSFKKSSLLSSPFVSQIPVPAISPLSPQTYRILIAQLEAPPKPRTNAEEGRHRDAPLIYGTMSSASHSRFSPSSRTSPAKILGLHYKISMPCTVFVETGIEHGLNREVHTQKDAQPQIELKTTMAIQTGTTVQCGTTMDVYVHV
ncbi:hypothetical protein DFH06DRAFT_1301356 [Mycena polygramma]|nr:hypothetical protein DFH06DRAFT_1301356 [Mycena polygramma]